MTLLHHPAMVCIEAVARKRLQAESSRVIVHQ